MFTERINFFLLTEKLKKLKEESKGDDLKSEIKEVGILYISI